jgi:hypothetical protein
LNICRAKPIKNILISYIVEYLCKNTIDYAPTVDLFNLIFNPYQGPKIKHRRIKKKNKKININNEKNKFSKMMI